jgi:hypothetical protein
VVCANAALTAIAPAALIAKILANVLSFMFVLCFVKRMIPVVTNFDWPPAGVIQPQKGFVNSFQGGRIATAFRTPGFSSLKCNR